MTSSAPSVSNSVLMKRNHWLVITGGWVLIIVALCSYAIIQSRKEVVESALLEARTHIDKDIAYRKWVAQKGGVYVPVSEGTPPNPYLNLPNRDVVTTEGVRLTLVNPAYMTRQVHEAAAQEYGTRGHLTSLKPIRPENSPDSWEEAALRKFESGEREVSEEVDMDGNSYLRMMRAFVTEKSCLKCHAYQGYVEDDVRGGISVSVPLDKYFAVYRDDLNGTLIGYGIILLIGLFGIRYLKQRLNENARIIVESEQRLKKAQSIGKIGDWSFDPVSTQFMFSEQMYELLGRDPRLGPPSLAEALAYFHPDDAADVRRHFGHAVETGDGWGHDARVILPDGKVVWHRGTGMAERDASGKVVRVFGTTQDVTERKQAELENLRLTHMLQESQHIAHIGGWEIDIADNSLYWSHETYLIHETTPEEYTPTIESAISFYTPESVPLISAAVKAAIEEGRDFQLELDLVTAKGRPIRVYATSQVIRENGVTSKIIGAFQDITEHRQLEAKLLQSQKMEAVGQLAGGVAHDFNNILTVISGYCSLLQMDQDLNDLQKSKLEQIAVAAEKAAHLTHGLLAFSRKQSLVMRLENLNEIIQEFQKFIARIIGEDIQFIISQCGAELPVLVDRNQIEQVLINLATNARDAMPRGGSFSVKAEQIVMVESSTDSLHSIIPSGRYALLSVSDTGIGIRKEDLNHIFEPFFTTKEMGRGTGLGLAIIYGIIKQHNGYINVYSEPGQGTVFRIYLPIHEAAEIPVAGKSVFIPPQGGGETILVAEDDPAVQELMLMILSSYGYDVILADNGVDAVEKFKVNKDRIDLVLLDVIMPKKNGRDAFEEIVRIKPEIKALFSSGYTADFIENRGVSEEGIELITKPVQPMELLRKVREVLDS